MESRFHDSCAQPCCLQVSDNHQNKQLTQMLFLSSPFHSPFSPDLAPTTRNFFYPSLFLRRNMIPVNPEHLLVHPHISWWFLLSPLPFSMATVGTPTCISVCMEDTAQRIWAMDQQPPGCVPRKVENVDLLPKTIPAHPKAGVPFLRVHGQVLQR